MVGRPWAGELQLTLLHHGAGGRELVLVALNAFAIDQMRNVEQHLAAFSHPAADFLVERREHAVHLEAYRSRPGLALALPGGVFAKVREVLLAHAFEWEISIHFLGATSVYIDFEVHFGLAMQPFQIALKLALIGADGLTKSFIVLKDSTETEG